MLVQSAIKTKDGKIYQGCGHANIIKENIDVDFKNSIQGFVTEKGMFMDRQKAYLHAIECGQLSHKKKLIGSVLTSEDLWKH